jgi:hypothetical protein
MERYVVKILPVLAALALGLYAASADAKTFAVPDDDPIATVTVPDTWGPNPYDGGVEATSADGTVYIAVEQVTADDVKSAIEEGFKFFLKQGVEVDPATQKTQDIKINGLDAFDMSISGKDKDGPADISLTLVETNAKTKFLLLYYWGSPEGAKANAAELKTISDSIQPTK